MILSESNLRNTFVYISCLLLFFALSGCFKDNKLKERELDIKEKELDIREKELEHEKNEKDDKTTKENTQENKRKLQFLFSSNGGLVGYFNDGSVAGCPRCDLIRENVKSLLRQKTNGYYTVNSDGSLNLKSEGRVIPKLEDGWVMINYKWLVDLE